MSWNVAAIGKAAAVKAAIETQFTLSSACNEPEETIRLAARGAIAAAMAGETDPACVVKVTASGSQSEKYNKDGSRTGLFANSLSLNVETLWGFVE